MRGATVICLIALFAVTVLCNQDFKDPLTNADWVSDHGPNSTHVAPSTTEPQTTINSTETDTSVASNGTSPKPSILDSLKDKINNGQEKIKSWFSIGKSESEEYIEKMKNLAKTYNPARLTEEDLKVILYGFRLVVSPIQHVVNNPFISSIMFHTPFALEWQAMTLALNLAHNTPALYQLVKKGGATGLRILKFANATVRNPTDWKENLLESFPTLNGLFALKDRLKAQRSIFSKESIKYLISNGTFAIKRAMNSTITAIKHIPNITVKNITDGIKNITKRAAGYLDPRDLSLSDLKIVLTGANAATNPILKVMNQTFIDKTMKIAVGPMWSYAKTLVRIINDPRETKAALLDITPFGNFLYSFISTTINDPENWQQNFVDAWPELGELMDQIEKAKAARPPVDKKDEIEMDDFSAVGKDIKEEGSTVHKRSLM